MSMTIGNLNVIESWTEYAVDIGDGVIYECEDRAEAESIVDASSDGARLMSCHYYRTEYEEVIR